MVDKNYVSLPPKRLGMALMVFPTMLLIGFAAFNFKGISTILICLSGILILFLLIKFMIPVISKSWVYFKTVNGVLYYKDSAKHWVTIEDLKKYSRISVTPSSVLIETKGQIDEHTFKKEDFNELKVLLGNNIS